MPQYRRKLKVMDLIRGSLNLEKQMAWVFAQVFLAFAVVHYTNAARDLIAVLTKRG